MKSIILIHLAGEDKPGVTAQVTGVLSSLRANLLDISQEVIYRQLTLGLMVEIPDEEDPPALEETLNREFSALGLSMKLSTLPMDEYEKWVAKQGNPRFIITLLARKISTLQFSEVCSTLAEQGLSIINLTRLSSRFSLKNPSASSKACVEIQVRGMPQDEKAMKVRFLEISKNLEVDISFQQETIYRRNRRLVAFDMDSTLIQVEVIDELAREKGVLEQVAKITEAAMQGKLDFKTSLRKRLSLLKGLDEKTLKKIANRLPLTEGTERLMKNLKAMGYRTAIISGGFRYFGEHLQKRLGFNDVFTNDLEIRNGKLTGKVKGEIIDGKRKASLLTALAKKQGLNREQVVAVGDGANDIPMITQAGLGVAFHAKPLVRQGARHSISTIGLDAILYLMGIRDRDAI